MRIPTARSRNLQELCARERADHEAGIRIGGEDNHLLSIETL